MRCLVAAIVLLPAALCFAADTAPAGPGLGVRTLFDGTAAEWTVAEGATCAATKDGIVLSSGKLTSAWAAPKAATAAPDDATLTVDVAEVKNGSLTIQLEWFSEAGTFLAASNAAQNVATPMKKAFALSEVKPKDAPNASQVRVKLWAEGAGAEAKLGALTLTAPRQWRAKNVRMIKDFLTHPKLEPDKGLHVTEAAPLDLALDADVPYASAAFADRADVSAQGVVLVDVDSISAGGLTVQLVTFDKDGKYLASIDLVKDLTTPGLVEVPLKIYRSSIPATAATGTLKLWLSGKAPRARVSGLYLGTTEK